MAEPMVTRTPAIRRIIEIEPPVAGSEPGAAAAERTSGAGGVTAGDVTTGGSTPASGAGARAVRLAEG